MELFIFYFFVFVVIFFFYFSHFGFCPSLTASNLVHFFYFSSFLISFTLLFFLVFFIIYDKGDLQSKDSLLNNYFYKVCFFIVFCIFFSILFNHFVVVGKFYVQDDSTYTWIDLFKIIFFLFISTFYDDVDDRFCFIFFFYDFFFFECIFFLLFFFYFDFLMF